MRSLPKYCCLFVITLSILCKGTVAQHGAEVLPTQFEEYIKYHPAEKLFVHTDKSVYVAGEIIWFKVYAVDAAFHIPTELSKVAYVEVLDNSKTALLRAKIQLQKGSGNGSFLLPASVNSGNFYFGDIPAG